MTDGNVIDLGVITTLDLNPDRVLEAAKERLEYVVIVGFDKDGDFYFASSRSDGGDCIWVLEMAKKQLLEVELDPKPVNE